MVSIGPSIHYTIIIIRSNKEPLNSIGNYLGPCITVRAWTWVAWLLAPGDSGHWLEACGLQP